MANVERAVRVVKGSRSAMTTANVLDGFLAAPAQSTVVTFRSAQKLSKSIGMPFRRRRGLAGLELYVLERLNRIRERLVVDLAARRVASLVSGSIANSNEATTIAPPDCCALCQAQMAGNLIPFAAIQTRRLKGRHLAGERAPYHLGRSCR